MLKKVILAAALAVSAAFATWDYYPVLEAGTMGKGGEITRVGITKATALEAVRTALGGAQEWRTMALGDSNNDKQMIQLAGIGVAMGNADDDIKQVADFITLDNNSDGVAYALKHFGLIQD